MILAVLLFLGSAAAMKNKTVDMTKKAHLQFDLSELKLFCGSNYEEICNPSTRNFRLYFKVCSLLFANNKQLITKYKDQLTRFINDTVVKECGSLDDTEIFTDMDQDEELICGVTLNQSGNNTYWNDYRINYKDTLNIQKWDGVTIVVSIFATMEQECIDTILSWNIGNISLPSYSSKSKNPYLKFILENEWNSSKSDIISIYSDNVTLKHKNANYDFMSQLLMKMQVHCPKNYYLSGCWYFCISNIRIKSCDSENGYQSCNEGWYKSDVLYLDYKGIKYGELKNVTIEECNMVDGCYKNACPELCKRTGNNTFACVEHVFLFDPPYLIVMPGDIIRCYLDMTSISTNENLNVSWEYVNDTNNLAFNNMIIKGDLLEVLHGGSYGSNNLMECVVRDSANVRRGSVIRNYTIIKIPTTISVNVTMQHVYLGDFIQCKSDARPVYSFQYVLNITTNNFFVDGISDTIRIPQNANLGEMLLNCYIVFADVNGSSTSFYRMFRIYIYVMRQFKWSLTNKALYDYENIFSLIIDIGVSYETQVLQINGPSEVETITNNQVQFNDKCLGGIYKFLGSLYIIFAGKFISFHQILTTSLIGSPTYLKFSHIIGFHNEKIYCLFDGYPRYLINVNFSLKNSENKEIIMTNKTKLTLPNYGVIDNAYIISCDISMRTYDALYNDSVEDNILIKVRPEPYKLVERGRNVVIPIVIIFLIYLIIQVFLTLFVLSRFRIIVYGIYFDYIFKTFVLYNRYRKNIRYDEKMRYISNIILETQKHTQPGEKLKLKTFYHYLKKRYRESFTPGYTTVSSHMKHKYQKLDNISNLKKLPDGTLQSTSIVQPDFVPVTKFYGLGPHPMGITSSILS